MSDKIIELDASHWHEVLDRAAVASAHLKMAFSGHPAVTQTQDISNLLETAISAIDDLYEGIHRHRFPEARKQAKTVDDEAEGTG
jgi:hypothetical protein